MALQHLLQFIFPNVNGSVSPLPMDGLDPSSNQEVQLHIPLMSQSGILGIGKEPPVMEEKKLQRASELIQEIGRITKGVRINRNQCAFLRTVCFQVDVYIQVWSKDFALELNAMPDVVQELLHVLEKCLKLVESYFEEDWLRRVFISRENNMEFEGIVEQLCKCTDLINQGLAYDKQRCEWKGEWIRKLKKTAMENVGFHREGLKFNAEQDRIVLKATLNGQRAKLASIKPEDLSAEDKQTQAVIEFLSKLQQPQKKPFNVQDDLYNIDHRELVFHKLIGEGTYGKVYKVTWLGQALAAKQTDGHSLNKEAEVMAKLQPCHPHVVQVIGHSDACSDDAGEKKLLIMELMGTDLEQLMARQRRSSSNSDGSPFSLPTAIELMLQIAKGMSHLHDRGVVHRDLKPKNILLNSDGNNVHFDVKLADFGVSKPNFHSNQKNTYRKGTLKYMAPEMLGRTDSHGNEEEGFYGRKVDVYSFAITCSEILSGKQPFGEQFLRKSDLKNMIVKEGKRPELPPNCPKDLLELISKCWDGDPNNRPGFEYISQRLWSIRCSHLLKHAYVPFPPPSAESNSSSSPGIKNLCIVGKAVIGEKLMGSGELETGVSTCICYWVRKYGDGITLRLGKVQEMTRDDPKPSYTITADDYDTTIALECSPLAHDLAASPGVTVYADDERKVEYGPNLGRRVELNCKNQHVQFDVQFEGLSFMERFGTLRLNYSDYQLWWNPWSSRNIREKYTRDVSIALSAKDPLACLLTRRPGVFHGIKFKNARARDVAVLTMRRFIKTYLSEQE